MDTTALLCVLSGHPASNIETDRWNRRYEVCSNSLCGNYEISRRAATSGAVCEESRFCKAERQGLIGAESHSLCIGVTEQHAPLPGQYRHLGGRSDSLKLVNSMAPRASKSTMRGTRKQYRNVAIIGRAKCTLLLELSLLSS